MSQTVLVQEVNQTVTIDETIPVVVVVDQVITVVEIGIRGPAGPPGSGGNTTYVGENKDTGTFAIGAALAVDASGVGVVKASAADNTKHAAGLATVGVIVGAAETVQTDGIFTRSDWTSVTGTVSLAAKAVYYLSASPGMLTTAAPAALGQVVQPVGLAVSADTLELEIEKAILL